MTTLQRPIIGAGVAPSREPALTKETTPQAPASDMLIAKDLPAWDLLPSDLLVVRRRAVKK